MEVAFKNNKAKLREVITDKRKLKDLKEYILLYRMELDKFFSDMSSIDIQKKIINKSQDLIDNSCEYHKLLDVMNKI